jgi:hypothetical protein
MIMDLNIIKAIGFFLQSYHSDLNYMLNFQRFKINGEGIEYQLQKKLGTLKSFIDEYMVARTFKKEETEKLFQLSLKWVKRKDCDDVDGFAEYLKDHEIADGKLPLSLSSKILFLNNPWLILPMDRRSKNAVKLKDNKYSTYQYLVSDYRHENSKIIQESLLYLKPYTTEIEKEFKKPLFKIEIIRENRFIDKLLWTMGGN